MKRTTRTLALAAPIAAAAITLGAGAAQADHHLDGPGTITNPTDPTHPGPGDGAPDDFADADHGDSGGNGGGNGNGGSDKRVNLPKRIDAGFTPESTEAGLALAWVLAGGAVVTAVGGAAAVGARRQ